MVLQLGKSGPEIFSLLAAGKTEKSTNSVTPNLLSRGDREKGLDEVNTPTEHWSKQTKLQPDHMNTNTERDVVEIDKNLDEILFSPKSSKVIDKCEIEHLLKKTPRF